MLENLTEEEKEIMYLFAQGRSCAGIMELFSFDYSRYKNIKKSLFKKLHITRIIQILPLLMENDMVFNK